MMWPEDWSQHLGGWGRMNMSWWPAWVKQKDSVLRKEKATMNQSKTIPAKHRVLIIQNKNQQVTPSMHLGWFKDLGVCSHWSLQNFGLFGPDAERMEDDYGVKISSEHTTGTEEPESLKRLHLKGSKIVLNDVEQLTRVHLNDWLDQ